VKWKRDGWRINSEVGKVKTPARLAYRLYAICERKGRAQEALAYNTLVTSWAHIQATAASPETQATQGELFG